MVDFMWLSQEARQIHAIFQNVFYTFVTVLLLIGVMLEYFKFFYWRNANISNFDG